MHDALPPLINIGYEKNITIRDLAEMVQEVTGYEGELRFDTSKPDGAPRKLLDVSNLNRLGWSQKTELNAGIGLAYRDYLARVARHARPVPTYSERSRRVRVNGGLPGEQHWVSPANAVDTPVEGIVLDINEESAASQTMLFKLQESTGFVKDILARVEEDVWNGL